MEHGFLLDAASLAVADEISSQKKGSGLNNLVEVYLLLHLCFSKHRILANGKLSRQQ
jgi:hypothetical protein